MRYKIYFHWGLPLCKKKKKKKQIIYKKIKDKLSAISLTYNEQKIIMLFEIFYTTIEKIDSIQSLSLVLSKKK